MTPTELEALVGHLFIVGRRTISTASPGSISMAPPRRAARGRDEDSFFGLLTMEPGENQPATFYEQLGETAATTYYKTGGAVTTALKEAFSTVNTELRKINMSRHEPLSIGLTCAVMREQEIYVAVSGPARCILIREGYIERLPSDDELKERIVALGIDSDPDIKFYRREIRAGDFIILTDSSFNRLTDTTLRHAVSTDDVNDAMNNLIAVAREFSAAEIIKIVEPLVEGETDHIPHQQQRTRVPPLPDYPSQPARPFPPAGTQVGPEPGSAALTASSDNVPPLPVTPRPARSLRGIGHAAALWFAGLTGKIRTLLEKGSSEKDEGQPLQLSLEIQIGTAVAVAVLVALITTAVYSLRGQTKQYAQFIRDAQSEIQLARAAGDDQAEARPHWEWALYLLNQAADIRTPGAEIQALRDEALSMLDSYDHVTRVTPVLLRSYEPGAYLQGPVVQGLNLYVLDTTQDILYREDLDQTGTTLVNRDMRIVTRQGELVGNQVIGGLIDLVWMEDGGVPQKNVLAVLARNGLLITYSPSWDVTAILLPGFEAWGAPQAIAIFGRDLYILDSGANEIWRYAAGVDSYETSPRRYFTDYVPSLGDAIDLAFDTNGNLLVLHADGRISKYFNGRPEPFEYTGLPQPVSRPRALHLNLSLYDRSMFVADPGGKRLYNLALNGAFLSNLIDDQDTIFSSLSGVFCLDQPPLVYVTAGSSLYYFQRP